MLKKSGITLTAILGTVTVLSAACTHEETVSFSAQVKPILDANCERCHQPGAEGHEASGFSVVSYEDIMAGSSAGPMVLPGDSLGSNMLVLMEGRADASISMPHDGGTRIPAADIETIRNWIDQGARNN
jgi:hypothetical protein